METVKQSALVIQVLIRTLHCALIFPTHIKHTKPNMWSKLHAKLPVVLCGDHSVEDNMSGSAGETKLVVLQAELGA